MDTINAYNACSWEDCLAHDKGNSFNSAIQGHLLNKKNKISAVKKFASKELYNMQIMADYKEQSSQVYCENHLILKKTILKGTKFSY